MSQERLAASSPPAWTVFESDRAIGGECRTADLPRYYNGSAWPYAATPWLGAVARDSALLQRAPLRTAFVRRWIATPGDALVRHNASTKDSSGLREPPGAKWATSSARNRFRADCGGRDLSRWAVIVTWKNPIMWLDFAYVARSCLRRIPQVLLSIFVLSIGMSSFSSALSLLDALALRALPFPDRESLFVITPGGRTGKELGVLTPAQFRLLKVEATSFSAVASLAQAVSDEGFEVEAGLRSRRVSDEFFRTIGVLPVLGHPWVGDLQPGDTPAAVVSWSLWKSALAGDPHAVGKSAVFGGRSYRVMGVMPKGFAFPWNTNLWTQLVREPRWDRYAHLVVVGRLRRGVTMEAAKHATGALLGIGDPKPSTLIGLVPVDVAFRPFGVLALWLLVASASVLLVIGCIHSSGMLLMRFILTRQDLSTRIALGASRLRAIRTSLIETVVVVLASGAAATLERPVVMEVLIPALRSEAAVNRPPLDLTAFAAELGIALIALCTIVLVPFTLVTTWKDRGVGGMSGMTSTEPRAGTLVDGLLILQASLAIALTYLSFTMVKTYRDLSSVDLGLSSKALISVTTEMPPLATTEVRRQLMADVVEAAGAVKGVLRISTANFRVFSPGGVIGDIRPLGISDSAGSPHSLEPLAVLRSVSPGYFRTAGIQLLRGRDFTERDGANATRVVILNEEGVRVCGGECGEGRRVVIRGLPAQVIGIAKNTRTAGPHEAQAAEVYFPVAQFGLSTVALLRVAEGDESAVANGVRAALAPLSRRGVGARVSAVTEDLMSELTPELSRSRTLAALGGIAVILTALAAYGCVSSAIAARRRDLAIRLSVGASTEQIRRAVLSKAATALCLAIVCGLALGAAGVKVFSGILVGVTGAEFPVVLATITLVSGSWLVATLLATRSISAISPVDLLRSF